RHTPQPHAFAHVAQSPAESPDRFLADLAAGASHVCVLAVARGQPSSPQAWREGRHAHLSLRRYQPSVGLSVASVPGGRRAVSAYLPLAGQPAPALAGRVALLPAAVRGVARFVVCAVVDGSG